MATIAETYRLTKKTPDLVWNEYVCRPVAAVLVHAVRDSRVTPNQITLASLGVSTLSAGLLPVLPRHVGLVVSILVFEASYVLDCADGMLARLRGTQSVQGHLLDFLIDEIKAFTLLAAASVRLYAVHGYDVGYLLTGLFGLVALATGIGLTTFLRRPEIAGPATPGQPAPRPSVLGWLERAAKLLIHYPSYIWLAAALGRLDLYLFPYVAVNALYAARTLLSVAARFGRK